MKLRLLCFGLAVVLLASQAIMALGSQRCKLESPAIYEQASPAVVFISVISIDPYKTRDRIRSGIGSGFIFDSKGYILTNSHVVFGSQIIIVTLENGRKTRAKLIGLDPLFDLAVLQIPVPEGQLPIIKLGDSDQLKIGDQLVALGNPFGLAQTLTKGILSGKNRVLPISQTIFPVPFCKLMRRSIQATPADRC